MFRQTSTSIALLFFLISHAFADDLEGEQLYRVSTVRAAPGTLAELLEWATPINGDDFFVLRHSQGDQWDLMFVTPLDAVNLEPVFALVDSLIAFREDTFAYGPPRDAFAAAYDENALFHIEMFEAVAGMKSDLVEQRRMENVYLSATGQTSNMIFVSVAGTDVDTFTIGFHEDLQAFATPSPASDDEREAAAKAAGFKSRADISFYLRSLISGHHDTLAVKVQ